MTKWTLAGSAAVAALMAGQAAFADISPEEVWMKWKDMATTSGQTVTTTTEARDGDTLMIEGAIFASAKDGGEATMTIPKIALKDLGDGSVEVSVPETATMAIKTPGADGKPATDVVIEFAAPGLKSVASGTAAETGYAVSFPEVKFSLVSVDGKAAAESGNDFSATVTNGSGTYVAKGTSITSDLKADGMAILVKVIDAESGGGANFTANMAALTGSGTTTIPAGVDMANMGAALKAGFLTDNTFKFGKTDFSFDFKDPSESGAGKGTMTGGGLNVAMDAAKLVYGTSATGVDFSLSGSTIPVPEVKITMAESAFNLMMPVAKSDTPADFSLLTKVVDLSISDEIWAMADPTAVFPHDPLTFVLDTKGTAKLGVDIMDAAAMEAAGDAPPGELNSLDLTELRLKALGAEVTGNGALTFDNTDMVTFDGVPKPTGTVTLNASGINALLDKVASMGMIPEDQLTGARMMMGMFAKPGEGEDTLTSTLEFKDGGFFANGMQLK
jgi:Uncharacterized protein conserved in bacteria (DUF2125)